MEVDAIEPVSGLALLDIRLEVPWIELLGKGFKLGESEDRQVSWVSKLVAKVFVRRKREV